MSSEYRKGRSKGFEEGGSKKIDAYALTQFPEEYCVGYVIGFAESENPAAPPGIWHRFAGEIARESGVSLSLFKEMDVIPKEHWSEFETGYTGRETDEHIDDDDNED